MEQLDRLLSARSLLYFLSKLVTLKWMLLRLTKSSIKWFCTERVLIEVRQLSNVPAFVPNEQLICANIVLCVRITLSFKQKKTKYAQMNILFLFLHPFFIPFCTNIDVINKPIWHQRDGVHQRTPRSSGENCLLLRPNSKTRQAPENSYRLKFPNLWLQNKTIFC